MNDICRRMANANNAAVDRILTLEREVRDLELFRAQLEGTRQQLNDARKAFEDAQDKGTALFHELGSVKADRARLQIEVAELKAQRAQHTTDAVHQDAIMSERIESLETQVYNLRACNDRQAKLLMEFNNGDLIKADQRVKTRSEYADMENRAVNAEKALEILRNRLFKISTE